MLNDKANRLVELIGPMGSMGLALIVGFIIGIIL
jgi:hypothetical protein